MQDLIKRGLGQFHTHEQDQGGYDEAADVLDTAVAEGVIQVGLLTGHFESDEGDQGRAGIGQVVEGIGSDGDGTGEGTCQILAGEEHQIQQDAQQSAEHAVGLTYLGSLIVFMIFDEKFSK